MSIGHIDIILENNVAVNYSMLQYELYELVLPPTGKRHWSY